MALRGMGLGMGGIGYGGYDGFITRVHFSHNVDICRNHHSCRNHHICRNHHSYTFLPTPYSS